MCPEMGEIVEDQTLTFGSEDEEISILLLKQEIGLGLIGMISSRLFSENVALVAIHGNPRDENFDIAYHGHSIDGKAARIGMDERLIDGLRQRSDEALFVLFHELGHFVNHDAVAVGKEFEQYDQSRKDKVKNGQVLDIELKADEFATKYLGVQAAINGLRDFMEREKLYYPPDEYDPEDVEIALSEIQNRIAHIENSAKSNK